MKKALVLVAGMFLLTSACNNSIQPDLASKVTPGEVIEAVDVRGHIRISTEAMRRGMHSHPGDRISIPVIKSDIQYLFSLGFEDVRVEEQSGRIGKIILYQVKEKATP